MHSDVEALYLVAGVRDSDEFVHTFHVVPASKLERTLGGAVLAALMSNSELRANGRACDAQMPKRC